MTRIGLALAVAAALVGCTTTSTLPRPRSTEELQTLIWAKRSYVTLLYEKPAATPPSLVPVPVDGHTDAVVAGMSNLRGFDVKRRGLGAFEGGAIGALAGLAIGGKIGADIGHTDRTLFVNQ